MKRLIFLRHAKTEGWHEGLDDHGRALVPRGHGDARRVSSELAGMGWAADHVWVSTSRRTRETARYVSAEMPGCVVTFFEELYLAAPQTIEDLLTAQEAEGTVMIIGHNPGLHELACTLARQAGSRDEFAIRRLFEKFPTCSAALFEADAPSAYHRARFKLVDVLRAKDFRPSDSE